MFLRNPTPTKNQKDIEREQMLLTAELLNVIVAAYYIS